MGAINKTAPLGEIRIKNQSQDWFDREISNAMKIRNANLKKFKKTKLLPDENNFKESKYFVRRLIKNKKKIYFKNKLEENVGKPKELWKILKSLGLPQKVTSKSNICLKTNEKVSFDAKENAETFKNFFNSLSDNLLKKLPKAPKTFGHLATSLYYRNKVLLANDFKFSKVLVDNVANILKEIDSSKAAGIDNIGGKFIKDGAAILALPLTQICNLSIRISAFPDTCKLAKVKPIFKKGSTMDPKNYRPISLLPLLSKIIEKIIHD